MSCTCGKESIRLCDECWGKYLEERIYSDAPQKQDLQSQLTLAEKKRKELRDYFAGCVAVGIMRTCDEIHDTVVSRDDIAMEAYRMADAMLKAREG